MSKGEREISFRGKKWTLLYLWMKHQASEVFRSSKKERGRERGRESGRHFNAIKSCSRIEELLHHHLSESRPQSFFSLLFEFSLSLSLWDFLSLPLFLGKVFVSHFFIFRKNSSFLQSKNLPVLSGYKINQKSAAHPTFTLAPSLPWASFCLLFFSLSLFLFLSLSLSLSVSFAAPKIFCLKFCGWWLWWWWARAKERRMMMMRRTSSIEPSLSSLSLHLHVSLPLVSHWLSSIESQVILLEAMRWKRREKWNKVRER